MASIPDPLIPPVVKVRDLIASPQAISLPWEGYLWEILEAQDFNPRSLSISGNITIPLGEFLVRKPLWELINGESPSDLTVDWTHYRARVVLPIAENFDTSVVDRAFKVNLEWMTLRLCGFLRTMERHLELPLGYIQERRSAIHQQIEDVVSGYPRQEITNHWSHDLRWGWLLDTIGEGAIPNTIIARVMALVTINEYDEDRLIKLVALAEQEAWLTRDALKHEEITQDDRTRLKQHQYEQQLVMNLLKEELRDRSQRKESLGPSKANDLVESTSTCSATVTSLRNTMPSSSNAEEASEECRESAIQRAIENSLQPEIESDRASGSTSTETPVMGDSPNVGNSPTQDTTSPAATLPSAPHQETVQVASDPATPPAAPSPLTAQQIAEQLNAVVVGQDPACRVLAAMGHGLLRGRRVGAALMHGPTGVGKSMLVEKFSEILGNIPVQHVSSTSLVPEGIVGTCISDILKEFVPAEDRKRIPEDGEPAPAPRGLLVIDEFDKLTGENEDPMNYARSIINALLRIVDGGIYQLEDSRRCPRISTKNIQVILAGSWQCLRDQQMSTGAPLGFATALKSNRTVSHRSLTLDDFELPRELRGRITRVVPLQPLGREDLLGILEHPKSSPWRLLREILGLGEDGLHLEPGVNDRLVDQALACGYGARWLSRPVLALADRLLMDHDAATNASALPLCITKDLVSPVIEEAA